MAGRGKKVPDQSDMVGSTPPNGPNPIDFARFGKRLAGGILVEDDTYYMYAKGLRPQVNPLYGIKSSLPLIAPGAFLTPEARKKELRARDPEKLKKEGYVNLDSNPHVEKARSFQAEWLKKHGQKVMEKFKNVKKEPKQKEDKPQIETLGGGRFRVRLGNETGIFSSPIIHIPELTEEDYRRYKVRRPAPASGKEKGIPKENQNSIPLTEKPPPTEPEVTNVPPAALPQERMEVDSVAGPSTTITKTVEDKAKGGEDRGEVIGSRSVNEMTDPRTPVVAKRVASAVQRVLRMKPMTARIGDGETNTRSEDKVPVAGPSGVGAAPAVNITAEETSVSTSASSIPSSGTLMVEPVARTRVLTESGKEKVAAGPSKSMGKSGHRKSAFASYAEARQKAITMGTSNPKRLSSIGNLTRGPTSRTGSGARQFQIGAKRKIVDATPISPLPDYLLSMKDRGKVAQMLPRIPRIGEVRAAPDAGPSKICVAEAALAADEALPRDKKTPSPSPMVVDEVEVDSVTSNVSTLVSLPSMVEVEGQQMEDDDDDEPFAIFADGNVEDLFPKDNLSMGGSGVRYRKL